MKRSTFLKTLLIAPFAGVASLSVLANVKPSLGTSPLDRCGIRKIFRGCFHQVSYYARIVEYKFGDCHTRGDFIAYVTHYLENLKHRGAFHSYAWYCHASIYTGSYSNTYGIDLFIKPTATSEYIGAKIQFSPVKHSMEFFDVKPKVA